jgi:hypothetical protein
MINIHIKVDAVRRRSCGEKSANGLPASRATRDTDVITLVQRGVRDRQVSVIARRQHIL